MKIVRVWMQSHSKTLGSRASSEAGIASLDARRVDGPEASRPEAARVVPGAVDRLWSCNAHRKQRTDEAKDTTLRPV